MSKQKFSYPRSIDGKLLPPREIDVTFTVENIDKELIADVNKLTSKGPENVDYQLGADIVSKLLLFDGKRLSPDELWNLMGGEYYTMLSYIQGAVNYLIRVFEQYKKEKVIL